jgi:hypothetical protein
MRHWTVFVLGLYLAASGLFTGSHVVSHSSVVASVASIAALTLVIAVIVEAVYRSAGAAYTVERVRLDPAREALVALGGSVEFADRVLAGPVSGVCDRFGVLHLNAECYRLDTSGRWQWGRRPRPLTVERSVYRGDFCGSCAVAQDPLLKQVRGIVSAYRHLTTGRRALELATKTQMVTVDHLHSTVSKLVGIPNELSRLELRGPLVGVSDRLCADSRTVADALRALSRGAPTRAYLRRLCVMLARRRRVGQVPTDAQALAVFRSTWHASMTSLRLRGVDVSAYRLLQSIVAVWGDGPTDGWFRLVLPADVAQVLSTLVHNPEVDLQVHTLAGQADPAFVELVWGLWDPGSDGQLRGAGRGQRRGGAVVPVMLPGATDIG